MSYVYVGEYNGQLVYVGKGKGTRFEHLNSGRSSCYEANRLHFAGGRLNVYKVVDGLTDGEAYELEQFIIFEAKPVWNVAGVRPIPRRSHNKDKKAPNATSEYLGVSFKAGRWIARAKVGGKPIHIISHATEIEAALARDKFVVDKGLASSLNF
ncbi:hypothetical protein vBPFY1MI_118 [Pseudomonas phage vB_PF_Y1-MI]|nr:hypothetical protein vBPFY1MI_118 [Pseudomonas phage vB_PF_Y1-MI]